VRSDRVGGMSVAFKLDMSASLTKRMHLGQIASDVFSGGENSPRRWFR
jgi:hypothetical protein